MKECNKPRR